MPVKKQGTWPLYRISRAFACKHLYALATPYSALCHVSFYPKTKINERRKSTSKFLSIVFDQAFFHDFSYLGIVISSLIVFLLFVDFSSTTGAILPACFVLFCIVMRYFLFGKLILITILRGVCFFFFFRRRLCINWRK